jgi:hypothetical protein
MFADLLISYTDVSGANSNIGHVAFDGMIRAVFGIYG